MTMTEREYSSSTDPSALRTLLVERGLWTEKKCRAFVEAWEYTEAAVNFPQRIDSRLSSWRGDLGETWVRDADWCVRSLPVAMMTRELCAALIRCIFGNPFRIVTATDDGVHWTSDPTPVIAFHPDWLTHANGNVVKLARAAVTRECERCGGSGGEKLTYGRHRCPACKGQGTITITGPIDGNMVLLIADALEESGCSDQEMLVHLRGPSEHWWSGGGGCWVLSLLVGEEFSNGRVVQVGGRT